MVMMSDYTLWKFTAKAGMNCTVLASMHVIIHIQMSHYVHVYVRTYFFVILSTVESIYQAQCLFLKSFATTMDTYILFKGVHITEP